MKQAYDFSFTLNDVKLPKYALYDIQKPIKGLPKRFCWVENPENALNRHFVIHFMNGDTGYIYTRYLDSATDGVARRFHAFALDIQRKQPHMIHEPIRVITCNDAQKAGAPHDRKPQRFITRGRPEKFYDAGRPATSGVVVGHRRLTEEGYNEIVLNIKPDIPASR